MKLSMHLAKSIGVIAPLLAVLSMGGSAVQAAAPAMAATVVVAPVTNPADCGKFTTATTTNLAAAIGAASSGTVLICPGTYVLAEDLVVPNASSKVTIKQAVTGEGKTPVIVPRSGTASGIAASSATSLTIDGLVLDMRGGTAGQTGLNVVDSSATIRNVTVVGSANMTTAINLNNVDLAAPRTVTVSDVMIRGCGTFCVGVFALGNAKLVLTGSTFSGTDGGRLNSTSTTAVRINGDFPGGGKAGGSIMSNTIFENETGVNIVGMSGVTVANNHMTGVQTGVSIDAVTTNNADNVKVTGNTISGIQIPGSGVFAGLVGGNDLLTIHKLLVSKNVIMSGSFATNGAGPFGVEVSNVVGQTPDQVTVTVSGNSFFGFPTTPTPTAVVNVNNLATVTVGSNARVP